MSDERCKDCNSMFPNASCGTCCPEWILRASLDNLLRDHRIIEWIIDHASEIHCKEMIAGNFENFIIPATREAILTEIDRNHIITP